MNNSFVNSFMYLFIVYSCIHMSIYLRMNLFCPLFTTIRKRLSVNLPSCSGWFSWLGAADLRLTSRRSTIQREADPKPSLTLDPSPDNWICSPPPTNFTYQGKNIHLENYQIKKTKTDKETETDKEGKTDKESKPDKKRKI